MAYYWWANHKLTYQQEAEGGTIWSPKANANGACNMSHDNLTLCQRGDVVFSYVGGRIGQIGWLAAAAAVTAMEPPEFGSAGDTWSQEGWLVRVNWQPRRQALVLQTILSSSSHCCRSVTAPSARPQARATKTSSWPASASNWACCCCG